MTPRPSTCDFSETAAPARRRLPADVRVHQILDAALEVFAASGFAATRIDDIARQAGLSKGGIYTHFKSKEEIFEALLARALTPRSVAGNALAPDEPITVELLIERVVDPMYVDLTDKQTILSLRLLVADGARGPDRVAQWQRTVMEPHLAAIEALVRRGVAEGTLRESVLVQAPWLLIAPGLYSALWQLTLGDAPSALLAAQQRAHVAMLREWLGPRAPSV